MAEARLVERDAGQPPDLTAASRLVGAREPYPYIDPEFRRPTCDGSTLTGLGIKVAGQIWYHALLLKTPTWTYRDARSATLTAAKQLFPDGCTVFDKVKAAWKAVNTGGRPFQTRP